jgi:hypothetical protein
VSSSARARSWAGTAAHSEPLGFALLLGAVLLLGVAELVVPGHNEFVYLPQLRRAWDQAYLARDWSMGGTVPDRVLFDLVFGPLTLVLPLGVVGWVGRVIVWTLGIVALLRLGRRCGLPPLGVTVAVSAWLFYGQAVVGGEWVFGTFEAKCLAWAFLFFALERFLAGRHRMASILLGLTASAHVVVGFWGAVGVGGALLLVGWPLRRLAVCAGFGLIGAAPGIVAFLPAMLGSVSSSPEDWRFITLVAIPLHFDPMFFTARANASLYLLFAFNVAHLYWHRDDPTWRLLTAFEGVLALVFTAGVAARLAEVYAPLRLIPFRLFPVVTLLFFFFRVVRLAGDGAVGRLGPGALALGVLALLTLGDPLARAGDLAHARYAELRDGPDDVAKAFDWMASHTPPDALAIMPPWRLDGYYRSGRAQVACWHLARFDRLGEWRERLESMLGDISGARYVGRWAHERYRMLGEADVATIARKYGADHLVSPRDYSYPVLFRSGAWKVYALPPTRAASLPAPAPGRAP